MPTFRKADKHHEAHALIESIVADHYPDLEEADLRIGVLLAFPKMGVGPALKHHGYPAVALTKGTSHEDRVAGKPDVIIKIDANRWALLSEEERAALIDHELNHIVPQRDKEGVIKEDDQGRPLVKMRLHDAEIGVFFDVIKRHGSASLDAQVCQSLHRELVQLEFYFEATDAEVA